ncbi:type 1 glutamine amidotransferase [Amphritea japonica]|uniref:GMP synthase (Glutamine-hydrolysing) n=1 Tax=Amphritea japonica ATCC BAA-1530 TaxID=1278309 RepID=A0A7R6PEH9_9GAMM|nr:type 1 glutamine amidotransferase [Amphritea japonica]BBB26711.1 GMP synthase (glutamine-hydrolysing) [Amphritea japonica ATCC BAA-1530]
MKIGILAAGSNEGELLKRFGSFAQMTQEMFAGSDLSFQCWDVCLGEFPNSYRDCDGWVITGSPASVYEPLEWIDPLEQLIRDISQARQGLVGICFGHQIIAQALGGVVEKVKAGWGLGVDQYRLTAKGMTWFGVESLSLHVIHQDQVVTLPEGAELLAGSEFCPYGALSYRSHILTIQAHPEFSGGYMQALLPAIAPQYITTSEAESGVRSVLSTPANADVIVQKMTQVLSQSV